MILNWKNIWKLMKTCLVFCRCAGWSGPPTTSTWPVEVTTTSCWCGTATPLGLPRPTRTTTPRSRVGFNNWKVEKKKSFCCLFFHWCILCIFYCYYISSIAHWLPRPQCRSQGLGLKNSNFSLLFFITIYCVRPQRRSQGWGANTF